MYLTLFGGNGQRSQGKYMHLSLFRDVGAFKELPRNIEKGILSKDLAKTSSVLCGYSESLKASVL